MSEATSKSGLYVAFKLAPDRVKRGCRITTCERCGTIVGHFPKDSGGHEIICLNCADRVPAIREHLDRLAKARGD